MAGTLPLNFKVTKDFFVTLQTISVDLNDLTLSNYNTMEPNTCQLQNEFLNATKVFRFISKLDIFPLISAADKV